MVHKSSVLHYVASLTVRIVIDNDNKFLNSTESYRQ